MKNTEVKIGSIEIQRTKGTEIWSITSGNFSIDKPKDRYRLNFWVESKEEYIQKLDDTGETPVAFEIKLPFEEKPNFDEIWNYEYPGYKAIEEDDFGEHGQGYWDNFYYYEHDSLQKIVIQIQKIKEQLYEIIVKGTRCDPLNWKLGEANYIISAKLELRDTLKSYWLTEE